MRFRQPPRAAFTLLEVILALALSALLLGALAMAIQVSLKATYSGRTDVAEAQLARAALERIGNDVRAAVWYEPPDPLAMVVPPAVASLGPSSSGSSGGTPSNSVTAVQSVKSVQSVQSVQSVSSTGGSGSSGGSSSGGSSSSMSASGGSGGGSSGSSGAGSRAGANATTTLPPQMPMFIGGPNWLQFDVSHLPRPDQYLSMMGTGATGMTPQTSQGGNFAFRDRISDTKTVCYFLAGSGQSAPAGMSGGGPSATVSGGGGANQGLVRREADRAVTLWSSSGSGSGAAGRNLEALAPEITALQFQYFNGSTWTSIWDSRTYGCLPRAVEIKITLADDSTPGRGGKKSVSGPSQQGEYVLRVPILAWRPPNLQLLNSMAIASEANNGSGSSSSSSSAGVGGMGSN